MENEKEVYHLTPEDTRLVVRRNELTLSSYDMTLQENRLFYWIMSMIKPDATDLRTFEVDINDVAQMIGVEGGGVYKQIKEAVTRLGGRAALIRKIDDDKVTQMWLFSKVEYLLGEGKVRIKMNDEMRPYLLNIKEKFSKVQLEHVIRMKSFYAQRIYDFLKVNEFKGSRLEVSIDELRKICGVGPGKLSRGNDFIKTVVSIARREINEITDLHIEFEAIKTGRSLTSVQFQILRKHAEAGHSHEVKKHVDGKDTLGVLVQHGLSAREAQEIIDTYQARDPQRIQWHVRELERLTREKPGSVKSSVAWLKSAIKKDYRPTQVKMQRRAPEAAPEEPRKNEMVQIKDLLKAKAA